MTMRTLALAVLLVPGLMLGLGLTLASPVSAAPTSEEVLAAANAIVAPPAYKAKLEMVAFRKDGTTKTYLFTTAKQGPDKIRLTFEEPKTLSGHEILRIDDDLWRYVPSLKRSMRIASRDDFEAGDFRNADVLRVDLVRDYKITSMKEDDSTWILDLSASTKQAGYDRIVYTVRKADYMPLQQEFYASSGKRLRTLTFSSPTLFGKLTRPSKVKMVNELAKGQYTEMTVQSFDVVDSIPSKTFQRESLGR
jgi:outer membrane lipoprotein-sorting protein